MGFGAGWMRWRGVARAAGWEVQGVVGRGMGRSLRGVVFGLVAAVAAAGSGCRKSGGTEVGGGRLLVGVWKVDRGPVVRKVLLTGVVDAARSVDLGFGAPGRVVAVKVKVGDRVRRGQLLARLDASGAYYRYRQAKAALARAKADLEAARRELARIERLVRQGAMPTSQLDRARDAVARAEAIYRQSRAGVSSAGVVLSDLELRAPFDGRVTAVNLEKGQSWSPGRQPAVSLVAEGAAKVLVRVPAELLPEVRVGKEITVRLPSGTKVAGRFARIHPRAERSGDVVVAEALVQGDPGLTVGMEVEVFLPVVRRDAVRVPHTAVVYRAGGLVVFVVQGKKVAERAVQAGLSGELYREIRSGLRPGEVVVVRGAALLGDGQEVATRWVAVGPEGQEAQGRAGPGEAGQGQGQEAGRGRAGAGSAGVGEAWTRRARGGGARTGRAGSAPRRPARKGR